MWVLSDAEALLFESTRELRERISSPTRYNLLRASHLVRQLLIDKSALVDQVNRKYRLKFSFKVAKQNPQLDNIGGLSPTFSFRSPTPISAKNTIEVNRESFLAYPILKVGEKEHTVRELVKHCANTLGGVHYEPEGRSSAGDINVRSVRLGPLKLEPFHGVEAPLYAVEEISKVALDALQPLLHCISHREIHVGTIFGVTCLPPDSEPWPLICWQRRNGEGGVYLNLTNQGAVRLHLESVEAESPRLEAKVKVRPNTLHSLVLSIRSNHLGGIDVRLSVDGHETGFCTSANLVLPLPSIFYDQRMFENANETVRGLMSYYSVWDRTFSAAEVAQTERALRSRALEANLKYVEIEEGGPTQTDAETGQLKFGIKGTVRQLTQRGVSVRPSECIVTSSADNVESQWCWLPHAHLR